MKKVIAGCIDLMLEFDSASELDRYIADIVAKKQEYSIVEIIILRKSLRTVSYKRIQLFENFE